MGNSGMEIESEGINPHTPAYYSPSKLKAYGFAIAIIVGIGGLAVGAAGLASYFHVGALSNMAQVDAIIMMTAGGGGGIFLFIVGVVGIVKQPKIDTQMIDSVDTQGVLVYGKDAWLSWGVEILDNVPPVPKVDLSKKDKILLYIPQNIQFKGNKQVLTLNALKQISGAFHYLKVAIEKQFGDIPAAPGWVLIDRAVMPESLGKDYSNSNLKNELEREGFSMPTLLEAVVLNLMVNHFTGERLYTFERQTFCDEKIDGKDSVIVGWWVDCSASSLAVDLSFGVNGNKRYGVARVQRKFNP